MRICGVPKVLPRLLPQVEPLPDTVLTQLKFAVPPVTVVVTTPVNGFVTDVDWMELLHSPITVAAAFPSLKKFGLLVSSGLVMSSAKIALPPAPSPPTSQVCQPPL